MKKLIKFKRLILLLVLVLPPAWCSATIFHSIDGNNAIQIIESNVQSAPKGSTIQASIDGHYLTVIFTQDIGTLAMELDKVSGPMIFSYPSVQTPDGSYDFQLSFGANARRLSVLLTPHWGLHYHLHPRQWR